MNKAKNGQSKTFIHRF